MLESLGNFFSDYIVFALKAITVIGIIIGIPYAFIKDKDEKTKEIEIVDLKKEYIEQKERLEEALLDSDTIDDRDKIKKKAKKALRKAKEEQRALEEEAREKAKKEAKKAAMAAAKAAENGSKPTEPEEPSGEAQVAELFAAANAAEAEYRAFRGRHHKPRLFVLSFKGEVQAEEVSDLSKEITATLALIDKGDEILVKLESPGGVIDGYGLGASQLKRIRDRNIPLTVAVDKVAASGGYMMACIGNKIVAAPFSEIGSIGVVAQIPNVHRFLKKHDVDVDILTAGKYKRTMTMLGENTEEGRQKFIEELNEAHRLFKAFVHEHRPQVDIEKIATGEYWFGTQARELNLVDEIATSDDIILDAMDTKDVFLVRTKKEETWLEQLGVHTESAVVRIITSLVHGHANKM